MDKARAMQSQAQSVCDGETAPNGAAESDDVIRVLSDSMQVDIFLYSGDLTRAGSQLFVDLLEREAKRDNILLVLSTFGGDADAAYIIARHIKRTYGKFVLCVFGYCKSAGTLLALGADEIVMEGRGEFGPLDVQLTKADEIVFRSSGLDIFTALDSINGQAFSVFEKQFLEIKRRSEGAITTRTAGEIATSVAVGLLSPITSQIDPLKLGEVQRAMNIAYQYGVRLNDDVRRVHRLVHDYPTHSFVIDFLEAQEVFGNVRQPNDLEAELASQMLEAFANRTGFDCVRTPHPDIMIACLTPTDGGSARNESIESEGQEPGTTGDGADGHRVFSNSAERVVPGEDTGAEERRGRAQAPGVPC